MATIAAQAPLLAFGPVGWMAFGVLLVGTTAAAVYMARRDADQTFSNSRTRAGTRACTTCPQQHRGRVQAQGGGLEKSLRWELPTPPTAIFGVGLATSLYSSLTRGQQEERAKAFAQLVRWISSRPPAGVYAVVKESFPKPALRGGIRMDIEVLAGMAFMLP